MKETEPVSQKQKLDELFTDLETAERFELLKDSIKILDEHIEDFLSIKSLNERQQAQLVSLLDRKKTREDKLKSANIESPSVIRKQIDDLINNFSGLEFYTYLKIN